MKTILPALHYDSDIDPGETRKTMVLYPITSGTMNYALAFRAGVLKKAVVKLTAPITAGSIELRITTSISYPSLTLNSASPLKQIWTFPAGSESLSSMNLTLDEATRRFINTPSLSDLPTADLAPSSRAVQVALVVDDGDTIPPEGIPAAFLNCRTSVLIKSQTTPVSCNWTPFPMPYGVKLSRVLVRQRTKITAGQATIRIKKNGVQVGSFIVNSATPTISVIDVEASNITFVEGDTIDFDCVTNSTLAPSGSAQFEFYPDWLVTA